MKRLLSQSEISVITKVAERLPCKTANLIKSDLKKTTICDSTSDYSFLTFEIEGYNRPDDGGHDSFGIQGEVQDEDGEILSFDLYRDSKGHLFGMELIRWDQFSIKRPDWSTLRLWG
jgi:hypothetical protein